MIITTMMIITMMMKLIIVDDGIGIGNDDDNDGELLLACHKLCLLGSTQSLLRIPNRGTNQLLFEIQIQIQMQIHTSIDHWKIV